MCDRRVEKSQVRKEDFVENRGKKDLGTDTFKSNTRMKHFRGD